MARCSVLPSAFSRLFLLSLLSILVLVGGCKKQESNEIVIGAIFSMTGDVGAYGERSREGFSLAVEKINSTGGIRGKRLVAIVEDAKSVPQDGLSAYRKLVASNHIRIIVGDVLSSTTMAIVPLIEQDTVLLFAPGASNPQLRGASKYFFRNWTSDDFDGLAMAHFIFAYPVDEVAILVQNQDYAIGLANSFEKEFHSLGGKIIIKELFGTGEPDFRTQIAKLKETNIRAVYLVGESRENGMILRQSSELGFAPRWFSNLTVDTPECADLAGNARDSVIFSTPIFDTSSSIPVVSQFVSDFRAKYKKNPEATSAHAYDAVTILASAIEAVGMNVDSIAVFLRNMRKFPGVSGTTSFDASGDVIKDIAIKQIRGEHSVYLQHFDF